MPVLLAYMGKQDDTDCRGSIMNVDWEEGGPHPITYLPDNVTEATFRQLRKPDDCDSAAALRSTFHTLCMLCLLHLSATLPLSLILPPIQFGCCGGHLDVAVCAVLECM